jgi:hypothetical protein
MIDSQKPARGQFAKCVLNAGHEVSLELNKRYQTLPDLQWEERGCLRVIDDSGEDYVYHRRYFAIPDGAQQADPTAMLRASGDEENSKGGDHVPRRRGASGTGRVC